MAKTSKTNTTSTPASPKGPVATKGQWDFGFKPIKEIPAGVGVFNNVTKLPFDWDAYAEAGLGEGFVPAEFWTEGRGYAPEDVTGRKCRDRMRRAFYAWQTAKDHPERKTKYDLAFSDKTEGGQYKGTYFYFMTKKQAA